MGLRQPRDEVRQEPLQEMRQVEQKYLIIFHGLGEGICCALTAPQILCTRCPSHIAPFISVVLTMGGVPREHKMIKGHLPRVIHHQDTSIRRLTKNLPVQRSFIYRLYKAGRHLAGVGVPDDEVTLEPARDDQLVRLDPPEGAHPLPVPAHQTLQPPPWLHLPVMIRYFHSTVRNPS